MRNALRLVDLPSRRSLVMWIIVLSVGAALFTWQGSVLAALVPVVVFALLAAVVVRVRRSLRQASGLIDTILREELDQRPSVSR